MMKHLILSGFIFIECFNTHAQETRNRTSFSKISGIQLPNSSNMAPPETRLILNGNSG